MGFELWGLDDLQQKKQWLEGKINEYNRLDAAYEAVQIQKNLYDDTVRSFRKDIFKDGWFRGSYDWDGWNYNKFTEFGTGTVKTEVDNYYKNGASGLDDVADALLEAKNRILAEVNNVFFPKFGILNSLSDLLIMVGNEIHSLAN